MKIIITTDLRRPGIEELMVPMITSDQLLRLDLVQLRICIDI